MKRITTWTWLFLLVLVSQAVAQTTETTTSTTTEIVTTPPPQQTMPPAPSPYEALGSITGIILATGLVTEVVKRMGGKTPVVKNTPTWVISVLMSCGLVAFAHYVAGVLPGSVGQLIWSAGLGAASSGGFYTWLREPADTPERHLESKLNGDSK